MLRTHSCGELTASHVNQKVTISGWLSKKRNLGGMIFLDLRDRYGITQVAINDDTVQWSDEAKVESFRSLAEDCKQEYVLQVEGIVVARPDDMINKDMLTGAIEVHPTAITILSKSKELPFSLGEDPKTSEANRYKHRYLDLRRTAVLDRMLLRSKMNNFTRNWFSKKDFLEVQTPIFSVSSPEGARDYLIPSRVNPGQFYALPQAPQQYKQLLMVGGIDKYFQIAPCFRDEDPRADRHSCEFYQIDCEMSFVEQQDVYDVVEHYIEDLVKELAPHKKISVQFKKLSFSQAIDLYGSDKPDLRFGMQLVEMTDMFTQSGFGVFKGVATSGGSIKALKIRKSDCNYDTDGLSRKIIDELTEVVKKHKAKGLAYMNFSQEGRQSSIVKFFSAEELAALQEKLQPEIGDCIVFVADEYEVTTGALGKLRLYLRDKYALAAKDELAFCWVEDFPMFEINEETEQLDFAHNPFSTIKGGLPALEKALANKDLMSVQTEQYDLACNGYEILSGSIRNHNPEVLIKLFELAGMSEAEIKQKFGAMYDAFQYGAPPHGGFAIGFDRFFMILVDEENIRECYAFPKSGRAQDVMMGAPAEIDEAQLQELGVKMIESEEKE